jgi:NAD(P)-dependent dehydrogenase (short-subunit alcohol dehydrogenase family)
MRRLDGRRALVTGAGTGIGAATVRRLVSAGASVTFTDIDTAAGTRLHEELGSSTTAVFAAVDALDETAMAALVASAGRPFDILVNNADAGHSESDLPIHLADVAAYARALAGEVLPAVIATKHVMPGMMRAGSGAVVNISSCAGLAADIGLVGHDTGKAAVLALTRWIAVNYARHGVRANAVCPGPTLTETSRDGFAVDSIAAAIRRATPNLTIATADDQAAVVEFLASDDARHINGVAIPVDGGMLAWNHLEVNWATFEPLEVPIVAPLRPGADTE